MTTDAKVIVILFIIVIIETIAIISILWNRLWWRGVVPTYRRIRCSLGWHSWRTCSPMIFPEEQYSLMLKGEQSCVFHPLECPKRVRVIIFPDLPAYTSEWYTIPREVYQALSALELWRRDTLQG